MKGIKTILGIALSIGGFGTAATVAGVSVANNNVVQQVQATSSFSDAAVYLDNSVVWKNGDERFAVYYSTASDGDGWVDMAQIGDYFYGARLPEKNISLIIFCRMNGSTTENKWDNKWNQTGDITSLTASKAVYKMSDWGTGSWQANSGYTSKFSNRYVACDDNSWAIANSSYKLTLDMTKAEGRLEKAFSISGSDTVEEIKLTDGISSWYGCSSVSDGTNSTYIDVSAGGTTNIKLKVAGTYEIYWKYYVSSKNIWIQIGSDVEADEYARTFISNITCTDNSVTSSLNAWNKVGDAKTSMEYKFEQLTSGAKHFLQNATPNTNGTNVEQCVARYDRILGKYGYGTASGQYHDFMGRTPAALNSAKINFLAKDNQQSTIIYITVVVALIASSVAGTYFFLRKKKEQ